MDIRKSGSRPMSGRFSRILALAAGVAIAPAIPGRAQSATAEDRYVRLAELEIDPVQAEAFAAAVREVGQASVRSEDGCLVLYAVAEKDNPGRVRVLEIYRDPAAYQAHLATTHFKKFREATGTMVRSRKLIDMTPISLAAKSGATP